MSVLACMNLYAQNSLSSAQLRTLKGSFISFSSIMQKDSLVLICFWSTESEATISELNAIQSHYEKWKEALSFKLMAVCIDEGKALNKLRPVVNMNDWTFDVYADIRGDLRKALNSNNLPQAMIIHRGFLVYEQNGFEPGSENYLFQKLRAIAGGGG
ncbi:MAG: redoxin domain-containing protein [Chitinophagales bacterium]